MLTYDRLSSDIHDSLKGVNDETRWKEQSSYLNYKIQDLDEKLAPQLQYNDRPLESDLPINQRVTRNFQVLLQIRINHLRIYLHSQRKSVATSISESRQAADLLVQYAKDNIIACEKLIHSSVVLPGLRSTFDYFLAGSLAATFVVVASNPADYGQKCSTQFHSAIKLLSGSSSRFNAPQIIPCTLGTLTKVAAKLNMPEPRTESLSFSTHDVEYETGHLPQESIGIFSRQNLARSLTNAGAADELLQWNSEFELYGLQSFLL